MPSSLIYANQPSGHLIAQVTRCSYCPTWLETGLENVPTLGHFHQSFTQFWHECSWKVFLLRIVGWLREISFWFYWLFYGPPFSPVDSKDRRNRQRSISLADIAVHFELPLFLIPFLENLCMLLTFYSLWKCLAKGSVNGYAQQSGSSFRCVRSPVGFRVACIQENYFSGELGPLVINWLKNTIFLHTFIF